MASHPIDIPTFDAVPPDERCLTITSLELVALNPEGSPADTAHATSCPRCSSILAAVRDNLVAADRVRRAVVAPQITQLNEDALPGYRIIGEIERGAQGIVYRAIQLGTGRHVAIKTLLGGVWASDRARRRFEREIEAASSLRHPGIVTVYDSISTPDGRTAYAMELIPDAAPLTRWTAPLHLSPQQLVRAKVEIFMAACDAVHYAHQRAVIHRDLKPSNIVVDSAGKPHVLDFGIARLGSPTSTTATYTSEFSGTLQYSAPEQVADSPDAADIRSDVYSLGVTLYEFLCGALPYDLGSSIVSAVACIQHAPPIPPSERLFCIDRDLETIILTALHKDRAKRYQSAEALSKDLARYLAGGTIEARRASAIYVASKFARRHRAMITAATLVITTVAAGLAFAAFSAGQARFARSVADRERTRSEARLAVSETVTQLLDELIPIGETDFTLDPTSERRRTIDRVTSMLDAGRYASSPHLEIASRILLADVYARRQVWDAAELNLVIAGALADRVLGPDHPDTMLARIRLASLRTELKQYALATRLLDTVQTSLDASPTENEDLRSVALTIRASILLHTGNPDAAAETARAALETPERSLGDLWPRIADGRDILAQSLAAQDKLAEALRVGKNSLRARFRTQSDAHPDIHRSLVWTCDLLTRMNILDEANMYREAAKLAPDFDPRPGDGPFGAVAYVRSDVFRFDGIEVSTPTLERGMFCLVNREMPAALEAFKANERYTYRGVGSPVLYRAMCHEHIASTLTAVGDLEGALAMRTRQLNLLTDAPERSDCLTTLRIQARIATLLARLGKLQEADQAFRDCRSKFPISFEVDQALKRRVCIRWTCVLLALGDSKGAQSTLAMAPALAKMTPDFEDGSDDAAECAIVTTGVSSATTGAAPADDFATPMRPYANLMRSWACYRQVIEDLRRTARKNGAEEAKNVLTSLLEQPLAQGSRAGRVR